MKFFVILSFSLSLLLLVASVAFANHEIRIENNCNHPVWPGILNNPGGWAGRIWGRTDCNGAGSCVTGDCGMCWLSLDSDD